MKTFLSPTILSPPITKKKGNRIRLMAKFDFTILNGNPIYLLIFVVVFVVGFTIGTFTKKAYIPFYKWIGGFAVFAIETNILSFVFVIFVLVFVVVIAYIGAFIRLWVIAVFAHLKMVFTAGLKVKSALTLIAFIVVAIET
jgi:hypothetical protein